jgi:hypothetical protein
MRLRDLSETFKDDMLSLLCGEELGSGMTRTAFACPLIDQVVGDGRKYVIKVETTRSGHFQNVLEWQIWNEVKDWKECARWLAPCVAISQSGLWLIQRRVDVLSSIEVAKRRAGRVPQFLSDFKTRNYGILDGRVVCHDYGTARILGEASLKLKKAEWWT